MGGERRRSASEKKQETGHNLMTKKSEKVPGTQPILIVDGDRAEIRLQRAAVHNRLLPEDVDMLERLFAEIDAAPQVRVAVLASSGKTFSAGFDIGSIENTSGETAAPRVFERMVDRLANLRVPTVAAIQGGVYGGAADLALACDFRIGVEAMELRIPAAVLGVHYYANGLQRFVTRLGLGAAKRIFLLAETLDASELKRVGYLDEVVPAAELASAVDRYAAQLSTLAPIAVQGMKRALNQAANAALNQEVTRAAIETAMRSEDLKTGLEAWGKRQKPSFRGN